MDGSNAAAPHRPEMWGGVECSVVRIGDDYRDQVRETGHLDRLADLDAIAALGLRTLRYPILWETIAPDDPGERRWDWHDKRLRHLRALGIRPIAGLVHHGSGPRYTSLLDPSWPDLLAGHARQVAERYPWIDAFTPVNEPLTTARFSCLYGHWYPHRRDPDAFLQALLIQCRATVLAMRAVREVNPEARLVQTEDIGRVYSTPRLAYQAAHENERRWLSLDLLCGRVDRTHRWHRRFLAAGVSAGALADLAADPCPPDVVGINYYLTSDRYLDENLAPYRPSSHGGNGRHRYADIEAIRAHAVVDDLSAAARLREAWQRYGLPVAVTEVHNGCTREEQLRWLMEVWRDAVRLADAGVPVRAVTAWSMFGAVDWASLLTRRDRVYEPGVFAISGGRSRRTALATAIEAIAGNGDYRHPVLDQPGWWRRPLRYVDSRAAIRGLVRQAPARPVLVTGGAGRLAQAVGAACAGRGVDCVLLSRNELDINDPTRLREAIDRHRPWAVINAAGYAAAERADSESDRCFAENTSGAELVARETASAGIQLVAMSSNMVFDGAAARPYVESDRPNPQGVFGATKAAAEEAVLQADPGALVVRAGPLFGPGPGHPHFLAGSAAAQLRLADPDSLITPTYVPHLVDALLDLLVDGEAGLWHLANRGAAGELPLAPGEIDERDLAENAAPFWAPLASERGAELPPLHRAVAAWSQLRI